jgi:imidazolonepropionase
MLLTNATLVTFGKDPGYGLVENGAINIIDRHINWIGPSDQVPADLSLQGETIDCQGKLVTPGLIDCHTHIIYAGDRSAEFEMRLEGASYAEIARNGGGIVSTVNAVREASIDMLLEQSMPRVERLISEGVTTIEIKSGYGLDTRNEIKMLEAASQLEKLTGIRVRKTFLGAHALPPEFAGRKDDYIEQVCTEMLPEANRRGLVQAVDGFAEGIAFSVEQIERVFDVASELGLPIKLHAEQLSNLGGARMAAQHGALSVDHLEYLHPDDIASLAEAGTVAVLLPGAFYFLRETTLPPIRELRSHNVAMAIATDCNPGSSPLTSLLMSMNMACALFSLTPLEALKGTTIDAAKALGLQDVVGSLETGKEADLVIWNAINPAYLSYNIGLNPCERIMFRGEWRKPPLSN